MTAAQRGAAMAREGRSGGRGRGRSGAPGDGTLLGGEELVGEVLGVHHSDPRTGFGVVEVGPHDGGPGERCSGPLADLVEGQSVRLVGRRSVHPRYGPTFEAMLYEQVTPTDVAGLTAFLTSDRFAHIPPRVIDRIIGAFGADAGAAIEAGVERIVDGADVTADEAAAVCDAWAAGLALARLVHLVEGADWPMDAVRSAHARFGADVVDVAREDPYLLLLAERVRFAHADRLAERLGVARDDIRRLVAGVEAAVRAARRQDGHQHLPRPAAIAAASALLGVDAMLAADGLTRALGRGRLVADAPGEEEVIALPGAHADEVALAEGLHRLIRTARPPAASPDVASPDDDGDDDADDGAVVLTADQRNAVALTLASGVSVLTGGPGTGKSTTVRELVARARRGRANVALAAPTGRAAKRLEELADHPATTIHRLLEARPDEDEGFRFRFGPDEPLPYDLVVVDETSMCDTWLAARLVGAIPDGAHLVLVGDADQLPSVGSGDVLRDLVRSGAVPAAHLSEIHRQAAGSRIVTLARGILAGDPGPLVGVDGDVFVAEEPDRTAIAARVVRTVAERAPEHFGVTLDDVQVLAPLYRGPNGVDALNTALKAALNPGAGRPSVAGHHVGDRVMQTRNDPELDVANGDVGVVVDLAVGDGTLRVAYPRGEVTHPRDRVRDLVPAWAVTVHKAQGGEWPVVVLVLDPAHRSMLWRNLAYTAVTRASRALILVGRSEALRVASRQDLPSQRHTGLADRLRSLAEGAGSQR
jgi:exodeoxyribonuclease V alpha subunit